MKNAMMVILKTMMVVIPLALKRLDGLAQEGILIQSQAVHQIVEMETY